MTTTTPAHTPLEKLLLYRLIIYHQITERAFVEISEILRGNDFVKEEPGYDAARLSPEALRELFLQILRDEVGGDDARSNGEKASGAVSPSSRKRKLPTPLPSTLPEACAFATTVVALIDKLWDQYKDWRVRDIQNDDKRIAILEDEIAHLEEDEKTALEKGKPAANPEPSVGGEQKSGALLNGTAAPAATLAPAPTASTVEGRRKSPAPGASRSAPRGVPPPAGAQTLAPPAVVPPGQFGQAPSRPSPRQSPRPSPAPVLQAPQGITQLLPSGPPTPQSQVPELLQRPVGGLQAKAPLQQPPTPPVPGALKWEPPYQPSARPASGTPPYAPQRIPTAGQAWAGQGPAPPAQQLQAQGVQQPQIIAPQPVIPTPQRGPPRAHPLAPPAIQGGPGRSPVGSPMNLQPQRAGTASPLPGASRPSQQPSAGPASGPSQLVPPARTSPVPVPASASRTVPSPQSARPGGMAISTQSGPPPPPLPTQQGVSTPVSDSPHHAAALKAVFENLKPHRISTPTPSRFKQPPGPPQTPLSTGSLYQVSHGSGTRWKPGEPTPSTPRADAGEIPSPAYEPLSPPLARAELQRKPSSKQVDRIDTAVRRPRGRPSKHAEKAQLGQTPSAAQTEELKGSGPARIKMEELTPRPVDETGDTTAEESTSGRRHVSTPAGPSSRVAKRKRASSVAPRSSEPTPAPPAPPAPPTHVLWTRGFPKISASALDQIGSHRHANMFAHKIRDRDAPNYSNIIRHPVDLKSIRTAISHGNKAAVAAAAAAVAEGDAGASSVWLPISEDLMPPRGIINSAQLDSELVHMFANAIMYNPDSSRGLPRSALRRLAHEGDDEGGAGGGGADAGVVLGYQVDEDAVVNEARDMYSEVEKLLNEMRSAEKQRGPAPPLPPGATGTGVITRQASVAGGVEDATEPTGGAAGPEEPAEEAPPPPAPAEGSGTIKRRRLARG